MPIVWQCRCTGSPAWATRIVPLPVLECCGPSFIFVIVNSWCDFVVVACGCSCACIAEGHESSRQYFYVHECCLLTHTQCSLACLLS